MKTQLHMKTVDGLEIFYRESGTPGRPKLLLLHGFPTSSHMFRHLIPLLADRFHIIAPDLPGFGFSSAPDHREFSYTFDRIAHVMAKFADAVGFDRFSIYVFDYGAPIGFRLAMANPGRIAAIISQNGNTYEEGLSEGWDPIRRYWQEPTQENRDALRGFLTLATTKMQYQHGEPDISRIEPESYTLDQALLDRPGNAEIQLDLLGDYKSNVALYPRIQKYLREHQPDLLAVWGKNDPFFLPAGAEAFKRDTKNAEVRFVDRGHFALESHTDEIADTIRSFLSGVAHPLAVPSDPEFLART